MQSMQEILDHSIDDSTLQEGEAYYTSKAGPKPRSQQEDGVSWLNEKRDQAHRFLWQI
jgi:hypothetical protein